MLMLMLLLEWLRLQRWLLRRCRLLMLWQQLLRLLLLCLQPPKL